MNIIHAIDNLVNHPVLDLTEYYRGKNRVNNIGSALEEYVKDLFAGSFGLSAKERSKQLAKVFSYLGNTSNPPDAMLWGGDAIEVKKLENKNAAIALNSSYPKHRLSCDSPMISSACRNAENWKTKDIIYAVGVVNSDSHQLNRLCMIYGLDYCAGEECYERIKNTVKDGVSSIPGVEFAETKELGHINRVDPLGITYMRVRGMWGIENPWKVFDYLWEDDKTADFQFLCIINAEKWATFDNTDLITSIEKEGFSIRDVQIKNPDNPAKLVDAKLIEFRF